MKNDLLCLIDQIDHIRSLFHVVECTAIPASNVIYDVAEFSVWKQEIQMELEDIHDRTNNRFIWDTLTLIKQGFNGWKDESSFNELCGGLLAIQKSIDKYYPAEIKPTYCKEEELIVTQKSPKIFISHSSADKAYVSHLVELLEGIGLSEQQLFCSSIPGYGIPLDEDIYDYLRQQFNVHDLHLILVLSDNYYQSVPCLNEMGAAWVLQNKCTTILLPGFQFNEIKGAVNPRQIGLKLDADKTEVEEKLGQLKDSLLKEFGLPTITDIRWERKRTAFIEAILQNNQTKKISDEALTLLRAAVDNIDGRIMKLRDLSGMHIQVGSVNMIQSQARQEVAKWEAAIGELVTNEFLIARGSKGEIFEVSKNGYDFIDQLNK